jgi:pilus assembly protein Flp/PilA
MRNFLTCAKSFLRSEGGPTATEYAVLLALIIVAGIVAIASLGGTVSGIFTDVNTKLGGH